MSQQELIANLPNNIHDKNQRNERNPYHMSSTDIDNAYKQEISNAHSLNNSNSSHHLQPTQMAENNNE